MDGIPALSRCKAATVHLRKPGIGWQALKRIVIDGGRYRSLWIGGEPGQSILDAPTYSQWKISPISKTKPLFAVPSLVARHTEAVMEWVEKLAEQRIQQAELEGAFDNLPGEGRPLPPDPFFPLPEEIRLAARVLTMCGCAPHELGLLRDLNEARRRLGDPGTAEEQAQRMREYCDAELRYNIAMDRHRQMFSGRPRRAPRNPSL